MRMLHRKGKTEKAIRHNITLPPSLDAKAPDFFHRAGYSGWSDYVQERLRRDLRMDRELEEAA
jgi:hypothetical protein